VGIAKAKAKGKGFYIARLIQRNLTSRACFTIIEVVVDPQESMVHCGALTNNWTRGKQPANTPPPQSTTPGLQAASRIFKIGQLIAEILHIVWWGILF